MENLLRINFYFEFQRIKPTKGRINQVLGHILVIALKQSTLYFIQTRKKRWSIKKAI